ncbi:MAG: carboxylating nicotinate-nucleotide diphosphorylase [Bacteroidia bacterium]|nr:carboxylating nicotinate-nucleotide diphosphorylase [Bacteroidia bacterium]MDW8157658.1 carboxylating nicotinate-nucleotide diphosphorylase [Bacteroidia bacterium]
MEEAILENYLRQALEEDIGTGDYTSLAIFPAYAQTSVACIAKESGIIAGVEVAKFLYTRLYTSVLLKCLKKDGERVEKGDRIFEATGSTLVLLSTERVILNIMQRMSGIATLTHTIAQTIAHTPCRLLDTRKTTPLNRFIEKWAVRIGGGTNHRMGLYDAIMLKDNHIDAAGGIPRALQITYNFLEKKQLRLPVIVEARNLKEVEQILEFSQPVTRILLDNMPPNLVKQAVTLIDKKISTEASGNINLHNAKEYAETGVDFISLGMLTHSFKSLDLSFITIN